MKQKLTLIILFLFVAQFCFSAVFHDVSLDEFLYSDGENSGGLEEMLEELEEDLDDEVVEALQEVIDDIAESYSTYHPVAKAFFESVPVDFEVTPVVYDVGWEDYQYTLSLQKDTLQILFYDFFTDEEGLHGYAEVFVNTTEEEYWDDDFDKSYATFTFPDFIIKYDGTIICGPSDDDWDGFLRLENDRYYFFHEATLYSEDGDYFVSGSLMWAEGEKYGFEPVKIGKAVIDMECNIVSSEPFDEPQVIGLDINGYEFEYSSIIFEGENICASGYMKAPGLNLCAEFDNNEIHISPKEITATSKDKEFSFNYSGFTFYGTDLSMHRDALMIFDASILFYGKKIPIGEMWLGYDNYSDSKNWYLLGDNKGSSTENINFFRDDDIVKSIYLDSYGIYFTISSKFPNGNRYVDFKFTAKPDGTLVFGEDNVATVAQFVIGDTVLNGQYVTFIPEKNRFYVYEAYVSFPENSCFSGLKLEKFYINPDGTLEDVRIQSFSKICGMNFIPDTKTFVDDGFIFSGTLYLPGQLPGMFSGSRMTVEKFYIGYDGMVKELVARREGVTPFYLSDNIIAWTKGSHLEIEQTKNPDGSLNPAKLYLCMDKSGIVLPSGYYMDDSNIPMENFRCNLVDYNGFNLADAAYSSNFELGISGMTLDVTDMKFISSGSAGRGNTNRQNGYFQFTGMITLPNGDHVPEFLRGVKAPAVIGIDMNACICKADIALGDIEGKLSTSQEDFSAFSLGKTTAHFVTSQINEHYLALVADSCSFVFTDAVPAWLAGTEIPGDSFIYDFKAGRYIRMSGTKYGFDLQGFTPEMEDVSISIDYSYTEPQANIVTVSGSMVSPATVSWGDGMPVGDCTAVTGTMSFDNAGNYGGFTIDYEY
ncbi:MAG: hypothetical protein J5747_06785 [Spirochaetaceae bacterium]|nr:hypothetical protein [Spirochaetaceae bacterium]